MDYFKSLFEDMSILDTCGLVIVLTLIVVLVSISVRG